MGHKHEISLDIFEQKINPDTKLLYIFRYSLCRVFMDEQFKYHVTNLIIYISLKISTDWHQEIALWSF